MASTSLMFEANKKEVHVFRFEKSNQTVSLTEGQLQRIPYLAALVSNANNFSTKRNEQGEFILKYPFRYSYFMIILATVLNVRPSFLFSRLPRSGNLLFVLELYNFLSIHPLPVPILEKEIDPTGKGFHRHYYEASPGDARDTAAEVLAAVCGGEYDMNDLETVKIIFNLVIDILNSPSIFGPRFRYQTLFIAENYCSSIFNSHQHSALNMYRQSLEQVDASQIDPDIIGETLTAPKTHMFHWRRKHHIEEDEDLCRTVIPNINVEKDKNLFDFFPLAYYECSNSIDLEWYMEYPWSSELIYTHSMDSFFPQKDWPSSPSIINEWAKNYRTEYSPERLAAVCSFEFRDRTNWKQVDFDNVMYLLKRWSSIENGRNRRKIKSEKSANSYFLRNRPIIEKYKSQSSRKTKKYRQ
ncbi:unnamed protein product [Rotaria magnacalcarata]|uniref:Uncharacterized protein n=2 Tax=Rotaria magnacalcarata TaxID=392030 RepID=A0A815ZY43_9BILA|nr:unnamed protein product [Rotaria magnacalcarata]CAF2145875.1 unnamed protein product [Rotaria magnacalcarata]CAF3756078.1 unnamed protein product [Rotaria magnacalcarata]